MSMATCRTNGNQIRVWLPTERRFAMNVFENLGEEKAKQMIDDLIAQGYSEDDAFGEVYSIECNIDDEE